MSASFRLRRPRLRGTLAPALLVWLGVAAAAAQELRFAPLRGARAEVSALLVRGENLGSVPVSVSSVERRGDVVELVLAVPRRHLLGDGPEVAAVVELHVYAFSGDQPSAVAATARRFEPGEGGDWGTLRLTVSVGVPTAADRLRLVVLNRQSKAFGFHQLALPAATAGDGGAAPAAAGVRGELLPRSAGEDWESGGEAELAAAAAGAEGDEPDAAAGAEAGAAGAPRSGLGALPPRGVRGGGSWRAAMLRREYATAYRESAAGDRPGAVTRIVTAELQGADEDRPQTLRALDESEARLLRRLAAASPGALVPLVRLYQDVVEAHHAAAHRVLAERARSRATRIALAFGEIQGDAAARSISASLLTGLAAAAMETNGSRAGSALLQSAVALEPGHPVAALLLGRQLEFVGQLAEAAAVLRPAASTSIEARLRLGVVLSRLGRSDEALRILREISERPEASWESAVATQELGRLAAAAGDLERAATLFEQNTRRFPADASSRIGLAYFLFRTGQRREARQLVSEMPSGGTATQRSRYAAWDEERVAAAEAWLVEAEERFRDELARAAGALAEPEKRR